MNSRRQNAILYFRLVFALMVFAISLALLIRGAADSIANATRSGSAAQDEEKTLDIARYANEPLELVDLKIHENSVKNKINSKIKGNSNQARLDSVKFREGKDWFKNVKLRLRNISGRPIYGLAVSLLLKDENLQMLFSLPVKESQARDLKRHPLEPGEEVDLAIDTARAAQILSYMFQNGVDPNRSSVQLSVEGASFGDDFGWRQGVLMRRNPYDPKKWDIIKPESSPTPPGASRLFQPAGFKVSDLKSSSGALQDLNRCVNQIDGFRSFACNDDPNNPCEWIRQYGDGQGNLTRVPRRCLYFSSRPVGRILRHTNGSRTVGGRSRLPAAGIHADAANVR